VPIQIVTPGGMPSAWVSEEHHIMETDVITEDGVYADAEGNRFQFRKGHVLPPGGKALLTRVGDFPEAQAPGVAEFATTVDATKGEADAKAAEEAKAQADADAKAKADADKAAADKAAADDAAAKAKADADKAAADKAAADDAAAKAKADADKAAADKAAADDAAAKAAQVPSNKKDVAPENKSA
jgi:hypothetical protein